MRLGPIEILVILAVVGLLLVIAIAVVLGVIAATRGPSRDQTLSTLAEENRRLREEIDRLKHGGA
jgi:hypothetical protein